MARRKSQSPEAVVWASVLPCPVVCDAEDGRDGAAETVFASTVVHIAGGGFGTSSETAKFLVGVVCRSLLFQRQSNLEKIQYCGKT